MNNEKIEDSSRVSALNQAALKLSEVGENQHALELLNHSMQIDNKFAQTYILLGLTYQSLSDFERAESHYREAIALDPNNDDAMQSLGLLLVANERKNEGVEWLQKYLERDNWNNQDITEKLTAVLEELGRSDEALVILHNAWTKSRKSELGKFYARKLENSGERDKAYWIWKILAIQPTTSDDYYYLGVGLYTLDLYEEAIVCLRTAAEMARNSILAEPGFSWEEYEAAGDMWPYEKLSEPHDEGWCYFFIARCYLELSDGNKALEAIDQAINTYGPGPLDYIVRTEALILLERYDEAINDIEKGISLLGEDIFSQDWGEKLYLTKAVVLSKTNSHQEALESITIGIHKYPDSPLLFGFALNLMMVQGLFSEGARLFEKAIRKDVEIQTPVNSFSYIRCLAVAGKKTIPQLIKEGLIRGKSENEIISFTFDIFPVLQDYPSIGIDYLRFLNTQFPNSALLFNFFALLLANQGDFTKAEKIFVSGLTNSHSKIEEQVIKNNLGYLYLLRGKNTDAEICFNAVRDIEITDTTEGTPTALVIAFYYDEGIIPDYMPVTSRAINPKTAALANLASLAILRGNTDTAAKHAIQVLSLYPENSLGYETLAFTFLAKGDTHAGLEALDKALDRIGEEEAPLLALSLMQEKIEFKLSGELSTSYSES